MDAFIQVYGRESPDKDLIVHTNQGSLLTGTNFQMLLRTYSAVSSLSRKDSSYDNALMESFYRTIKRELIQDANFKTPE
ncbi:hypothetical protein [Desulfitobacterium sp. AusDCA]|uniref:hypothetical protein n=1 Tax=Desulfitobacterium sp. AusDCA TaxID=3240383 RepID=UPI003DA6D179